MALTSRERYPPHLGCKEEGKADCIRQDMHLATVLEILSSIKAVDMSPLLARLYAAPEGTEMLDVLTK